MAGNPPAEQPPNYYRLLGISLFESDTDVIEVAADQRMAIFRSFQAGPHSDLTQKLLNEVTAAKLCLLKAERARNMTRHSVGRLHPFESLSLSQFGGKTSPSELLAPLEKSPPGRIPVARVARTVVAGRIRTSRGCDETNRCQGDLLSANPAAAATNLTPKNPPIAKKAEADNVSTRCGSIRRCPTLGRLGSGGGRGLCGGNHSSAAKAEGLAALAAQPTACPIRCRGHRLGRHGVWRPVRLRGVARCRIQTWLPSRVRVGDGGATPADSAIAASSTGNSPSSNNVSPSRPSRVAASGSNFGDATSGASHFGLANNFGPAKRHSHSGRASPVQPSTPPTVRPGSTGARRQPLAAPTAQEIQKSGQDFANY